MTLDDIVRVVEVSSEQYGLDVVVPDSTYSWTFAKIDIAKKIY